MPKASKKGSTKPVTGALPTLPQLPQRAGLPARDSIIGITTPMGPVMAGATTQYRIIHTLEMDEYERGATSLRLAAKAAAAAAPKGDSFKGKSRKAAKLSISKSKLETFDDLKDLIDSLAQEDVMISHDPPIKKDSTSGRVEEEERNVRVSAFIYAASREDDNDFHLIIGRDPELTPEIYMTMELSGLPPASKPSHKKLKAARDAFKKFYDENFDGILPGLTYGFPDPPIPVRIDGSLFFDITHATGLRPGPKSLKSRMPVIWEVHPITKMVF
jgi:SepF-like predicted cell division protein (DUF552 family)